MIIKLYDAKFLRMITFQYSEINRISMKFCISFIIFYSHLTKTPRDTETAIDTYTDTRCVYN